MSNNHEYWQRYLRKVLFSGIMGRMKTLIFTFFLAFSVCGAGGSFAQDINTLPLPSGNYAPIIRDNIVQSVIDDGFDEGTENAIRTLFQRKDDRKNDLITRVNIFLGGAAILLLVVLGARFIFAQGEEEKMSKLKAQFGWLILGLAVISVAEFVAFQLVDPANPKIDVEQSSFIMANLGSKINQIKTFFQIIITGIMLVYLAISGYALITGGENDETISNEKKFIRSFVLGVVFILMSEVIVRVLSNADPRSAELTANSEILGIINFILSFLAVAATIMLILSSLYFVSSFGSEDQTKRAKSMVMASVIGIVTALSSFIIITFFIR